ncbi:membrane protein, partial [mine drainage metagenome]
TLRRTPAAVVIAGLLGLTLFSYQQLVMSELVKVKFLLGGLGLVSASTESSGTRIHEAIWTLDAFAKHPIIGSGIGALPVAIAPHEDGAVYTIKEAKNYQGMSIFPELIASTGIVGGLLMLGFMLALTRSYDMAVRKANAWQRELLSASAWAVIWILMTLQMNQNFLRVYLYVDLAVLICCCTMVSAGGDGTGAEPFRG